MTTDISTPEPEALDDAAGSPGAADATKNDDKDLDYWKREAEENRKRRDSLAKREREAKEQLKALEEQLGIYKSKETELEELKRKQEDDAAAKAGDIEKLRQSAKSREEQLVAEREALRQELLKQLTEKDREVTELRSTYLLKNEVMREIEPIATPGLAQTVWLHVADMFELGPDMKPRPKDSTLDIKTFVTKHLEENGLQPLLRNERAKGTGSQPVTAGKESTATSIPADFDTWDVKRKQEWMGKNPSLAAQAAATALRRSAK